MDNVNNNKFLSAIKTLKSPTPEYVFSGSMDNETVFNSVKWKTGEDGSGMAVLSDTPPSGITWTAVKTEMDKL